MKKLSCIFFSLLIVFVSSQIYIYANTAKVVVDLRVEGDQSTLMEGKVDADTLIKAVQKLGELSNVEVILKGNLSGQQLYSIGGIEYKKYNVNDEWKAYIIRNNQMLEVDNIMNTNLVNNDKVVLYYGNIDYTKRVTNIKQVYSNRTLSMQLSSAVVTWVENNGIWGPQTIYNKLNDVNVHIVVANQVEMIQKTDQEGSVQFKMDEPNIYTYYIEGYTADNVPRLLKTEKVTNTIGIKDESAFTRAELVALLINNMSTEFQTTKQQSFIDVTEHTLYLYQIEVAQSKGIISGNGECIFRPEDKITMQEFAVILNNIYKDKPNSIEKVNLENLKTCDSWATTAIKSIIQKGIIGDYNIDWKGNVDSKTIAAILANQK